MRKFEINGVIYDVHEAVESFTILHKESSNVAFWGYDVSTMVFFVQFKNGSTYMYSEVPASLLQGSIDADSIGKFISQEIVKKFPSTKFDTQVLLKEEAVAVKKSMLNGEEILINPIKLDEPNFD